MINCIWINFTHWLFYKLQVFQLLVPTVVRRTCILLMVLTPAGLSCGPCWMNKSLETVDMWVSLILYYFCLTCIMLFCSLNVFRKLILFTPNFLDMYGTSKKWMNWWNLKALFLAQCTIHNKYLYELNMKHSSHRLE